MTATEEPSNNGDESPLAAEPLASREEAQVPPNRWNALLLVRKALSATAVEGVSIFLWLWLVTDGHPWWGFVALAAGEIVETLTLNSGIWKATRLRWGKLTPAQEPRYHRVNLIISVAGILEIALWLAWLQSFNWLDTAPGFQRTLAAGAVLFVLMHAKHQIEGAAIRNTPYPDGLLSRGGLLATAAEVAGAVVCLALIRDGREGAAGFALALGLMLEHIALIGQLRLEVRARDIRRPRDPRWKPLRLTDEPLRYLVAHVPRFWKLVGRIEPLARRFNRYAINRRISVIEPRPSPLSTLADYTSWASLTDRTYSGRHLPPISSPPGGPDQPDVKAVAELFRRDGGMINCPKSTVLFGWFAQWFTDGFLRTPRAIGADGVRATLKNESNHEIDLAALYGRTPEVTDALRAQRDGLLESQLIGGEEYPSFLCAHGHRRHVFDALPKPVGFDGLRGEQKDELFAMGTDVTNHGVVAMNVLFLRAHNWIARRVGSAHPQWRDERVFQTARNVLTVVLLKIIVEEYIHHISAARFRPRLRPESFTNERWQRSNWMAIEFNLLYRWHSLAPSTFYVNGEALAVTDTLFETKRLRATGLQPWLAAAASQPAGRIGLLNSDPWFIDRVEVPSIKQARNAKLCSYNDYRRLCRLAPARKFDEISASELVQQRLKNVYGHVDNVEFYVGLFAEDTQFNGVLPLMMGAMVAFDAFSQALTNPLLSPRIYNEQTFSAVGWKVIQDVKRLSDLVDLVHGEALGSSRGALSFTRRDYRPQ